MKKLYLLTTAAITSLSITSVAYATGSPVPIQISPPANVIPPSTGVGTIIGNIVSIAIIIGVIAVLFMLVWGAFEWITSGGDKESIAKARGRILNAIIGLVILALAFVILTVVGNLVGVNFLNLTLPCLAC